MTLDEDERVIQVIDLNSTFFYESDELVGDMVQGRPGIEVAELVWDPSDPHAVALVIYERGAEENTYQPEVTFARELLSHGTCTFEGVGEGTVRVRLDFDPAWMVLTIKADTDDRWEIFAPRAVIEAFVRETYGRFPHSDEIEVRDWDSGLLALLGGTS